MSLLGKGVNKLFTSLGSLLKKIVELLFDLLGFIKFKISKKGYNVREESSKNGKIVGRRLKNNMDKFAIKAQVETDKGMIFLGKFLRLFTFNILKLFNTVSRNLYKASEKSKDKFTTYNISQDEKNKEKFIEFDNLIAKCNDIENYAEAAISKNIDDSYKDLDKTLFKFPNTYDNSNNNNIEKYEKNSATDLDKTLYEDLDSFNNLNKNDKDWREMLSSPIFYVMITLLTCGAFYGLMCTSMASALAQNMIGMTSTSAAIAVSILALFNTAGRIVAGYISDKIGRINTLSMAFIISIVGLFCLAISSQGDIVKFYIGISIVGVCFGAFMGVFPGFTVDQFGAKNNSVNYGIMFIGFAFAGYIGPTVMKNVYASYGDYKRAFIIGIVMALVGLGLTFVYRFVNNKDLVKKELKKIS